MPHSALELPLLTEQGNREQIDGASGGYAVAASKLTGKKLGAVSVTP